MFLVMLCVHGQDVGVTKKLYDVTMKDFNDGYVGAVLKMLFNCFLAGIVLILYF